jgi:hypothetical protein
MLLTSEDHQVVGEDAKTDLARLAVVASGPQGRAFALGPDQAVAEGADPEETLIGGQGADGLVSKAAIKDGPGGIWWH